MNPLIRQSRIGILMVAFAAVKTASGADIFISENADGTIRYASQALDRSYRLYLRDDKPKPLAAPLGRAAASRRAVVETGMPTNSTIAALVEALSRKHQLDPALVHAVIGVESNANPRAVSPKGATGAMQLMPATAAMYGVTRLDDPAQNIEAGILHLKYLLDLHKNNLALALAAYNAGEGAVAKNAKRIPPYRETMLYVPAVLARMQLVRNQATR